MTSSGQFILTEAVPFRMTPNIQHFLTNINIEALLVPTTYALSRTLNRPFSEWIDMLHLFSRDEIFHWSLELNQQPVTASNAVFELSSKMVQNFELLLKRGQVFCCFKEQENVKIIELFLDIAN